MWEWAGQQVVSHHFRHLVSRAAAGADIFFNSIHQGPFSEAVYDQITPFYDMLEKGIVHIPEREQLLSLSDIALGMRSPPSEAYLRHGINGHHYRYPKDSHPEMVFDRLDCYWAGAPLASYDPSRYAMQLERRMCNYLPILKFGLIPIIPRDTSFATRFSQVFETDGQYFYDETGSQRSASQYRTIVESALDEASRRLPVLAVGEVHWSVSRIDPNRVRVTLIDPGYLDPAERKAEIHLQHLEGIRCTDILAGVKLPIENGRIALQIPAGTLRIVDIEHH
jgi:hypothetical protein